MADGYFVMPDGTCFRQVSMGGLPKIYRQPISHSAIAAIPHLNPQATHLEFTKTHLYGTVLERNTAKDVRLTGSPVYVLTRALRIAGALIDGQWDEVPLTVCAEVAR